MTRVMNVIVVTLAAVGIGIVSGIVGGIGIQNMPAAANTMAGRVGVGESYILANMMRDQLLQLALLSYVYAIAIGLLYGIKNGDMLAAAISGYSSHYALTMTGSLIMGVMLGATGNQALMQAFGTAISGVGEGKPIYLLIEGMWPAGIAFIVSALTYIVE